MLTNQVLETYQTPINSVANGIITRMLDSTRMSGRKENSNTTHSYLTYFTEQGKQYIHNPSLYKGHCFLTLAWNFYLFFFFFFFFRFPESISNPKNPYAALYNVTA